MQEKVSLSCTLCYDQYTKSYPLRVPRNLQCGHTFCTGCIGKLQSLQGDVIDCPSCQMRTLLPDSGVDGLPENVDILNTVYAKQKAEAKTCNFCIRRIYPPKTATLYCKDCGVYYCGTCSDDIHMEPEYQAHEVALVTAMQQKTKSKSASTRSSSGFGSEASFPSMLLRSRSSSSLLDAEVVPECPDHGLKMKIYCRTDSCLCCVECKVSGSHAGHDCFEVHEAEERERIILTRLQHKVELHAEKYIRSRGGVQKMIESVKYNTITVKDIAKRYYRELRKAIDDAEQLLLDDITKRSEKKLMLLNQQLTQMIEISSKAKRSSRNCDDALSQDYFTMLNMRKDLEEEMRGVLNMIVNTEPMAQADLKCQFPQHETLVNSMRTCAKLVVTPSPPLELSCRIKEKESLELKWDPPKANLYVYPVTTYLVQASVGPDNSFVDICKTQLTRLVFHPSVDKFLDVGAFVQFRVCAFNIVGQGSWCSPVGIKVPDEHSKSSAPSSISSMEDVKRMRPALDRENFVCWNATGKCK